MNQAGALTALLSYLIKSRGVHRLHSPFFFEFFNNVIAHRPNNDIVVIDELRRKLLCDKQQLTVNDLGAGPASAKTNAQRSVAEITRRTAKSAYWLGFLNRLTSFTGASRVLELGTGMGLSTAAMGICPNVNKLVTIEGSKAIASKAIENFSALQVANKVSLHIGHFDKLLPQILEAEQAFDLVFLDGNHTYDATMRYFRLFAAQPIPPKAIVIDDINWSEGMQQAWKEINKHDYSRQSIDLYKMGLVFNRQQQAAEHKILRLPYRALIK